MLENVDIDYENNLRSIYNVIIGDEIDFDQDPFFKAMKIPGKDPIPEELATEIDRTTENLEIDINQGG